MPIYGSYNPFQTNPLQGLQSAYQTPVQRVTQQDAADMMLEEPMQANAPVALAALRDQRKRELEQSMVSGAPDQFQATQANRLGILNRDIAQDPFTGAAEREKTQAIQALISQAQLEGFDSPQAASQYVRQQEERKLGMPAEVAELGERGGLAVEQARQRGALDVAKSYQQAQQEQIEAARGVGGFLAPGGRFSTSRTGFSATVPPERQVPAALSNQLDRARQQAEISSRNQPMLDQQVASVFAAHPANDDVKLTVRAIVADPKSAEMSAQQILDRLVSLGNDVSPQDRVHITELLDIVRGRMF